MAIKLDLNKAYDSLNWDFLQYVLSCFGVHPFMIQLIYACVSSADFQVLNNGSPSQHFTSSSSLRHGDLLSRCLFVVGLKVLADFMDLAVKNSNFSSFAISFRIICLRMIVLVRSVSTNFIK